MTAWHLCHPSTGALHAPNALISLANEDTATV